MICCYLSTTADSIIKRFCISWTIYNLTKDSKQSKTMASFTDFIQAIKEKNSAQVKCTLANDPMILLQHIEKDELALHIALKYSSRTIVAIILKYLKKIHLNNREFHQALCACDEAGDTPLHLAARHRSFKTFSLLIDALGGKRYIAAKQINKAIKLPLHDIDHNPNPDKGVTYLMLKKYTLEKNHIKHFNEPLKLKDIIKAYQTNILENPSLLKHLIYGYFAAVHVRKLICYSSTHPAYNEIKKEKGHLSWKKICGTTREAHIKENKALQIEDFPHADAFYLKKLETCVKCCKKYHAAKCTEYCHLVLDTLIKMGIHSPVEMYEIKNGDHVFTVIGRNQDSDPHHFTSWGENAVVVDAWAGEIYPAFAIPKILKDYAYYNSQTYLHEVSRLVFPFDPRFHQLSPKFHAY